MTRSEERINYGHFLDFPSVTHFVRRVRHRLPEPEFRLTLSQAITKLSEYQDSLRTSSAGKRCMIRVKRSFEVGIADGLDFNYLDEHEALQLQNVVTRRSLRSLDLVLFVHYRYQSSLTKKIASLRFDQYFLRIGFKGAVFTFFHVKGLKRTPPEEILDMIIEFMITNHKNQSKQTRSPLLSPELP